MEACGEAMKSVARLQTQYALEQHDALREARRRNVCAVTGKRRFAGDRVARRSLRVTRCGLRMRAYRCEFCLSWHLTKDVR